MVSKFQELLKFNRKTKNIKLMLDYYKLNKGISLYVH